MLTHMYVPHGDVPLQHRVVFAKVEDPTGGKCMVAHIGAWRVRLPTTVVPYGAPPKSSTMSAHISWFCAI